MSLRKQKLLNEIIGKQGYVMVPSELFVTLKGEPYELVLWAYLFNQAEGWHPSYPQIADGTGMSVREAKKSVASLVEKGLLIKHSNPLGGKNTYEFTEISSWSQGLQDKNINDVKGSAYYAPPVHQSRPFLEESKDKREFKNIQESNSVPAEAVATATPSQNNKTSHPAKELTIDDVRLTWMRDHDVLASRTYENRQELLNELMMSLKANGFNLSDLSNSFKEQITKPWYAAIKDRKKQAKAKEASLAAVDNALCYLAPDDLATYQEMPKKASKKPKDIQDPVLAEYDAHLDALDRLDDQGRPI